jgi:hypothetical protein
MVYIVDYAIFLEALRLRATRFWRAGGTVIARLPGLTVVGACDQQTLTNASGH